MNDSEKSLDRPRKKAEHIGLRGDDSMTEDEDGSLDIGALWETIKRSKWIILGITILITGTAVGVTMMLPQIYEASAVVSVEDKKNSRPAEMMRWEGGGNLSHEIGILENSGELAQRVITQMKTAADTTEGASFTLFQTNEEDSSLTEEDMVERLKAMVSFDDNSEQDLITITVQSESPEEAALVANVYAEEYRQFSQEMARSSVGAARSFLEEQLQKRKEDIREIENEWEEFARSNAVVTDGMDGQNVAQEYADLQTKRDALNFQLEQEERTLSLLQERLEEVQPSLRSSVRQEQKVKSLRTQIQALEDQIAKLKAEAEQFYINDPSLRGNESEVPELADITRRIDGYESRKEDLTEELVAVSESADVATAGGDGEGVTSIGQLGALRDRIQEQKQTIAQLEAQIRAIEGRIGGYEDRLDGIPRQTIRREQLERQLNQAEEFYKEVAKELQRTIVTEESELGYVQVMRSATVPMMPVSPNMQQNLLLGLLLGLGLGVAVAFVRQSMNWQIHEPDDIQRRGYSLVGIIPKMDREIKKAFKGDELVDVEGQKLSTKLFPLLNPWSPITENYRLVRANLQFAAMQNGDGGDSQSQLMMVTSPEPGDGKTTTAVNLAITIALSGRKVLLIDADMRRPNSHKMLGRERGPGLADVLTGKQVMEVIQDTLVDGLSLLSAGVPDVPPTELLDTKRMRKLLETSGERFDVVILDTPPVLAATDPIVVAPHCEAVLVVASADKTDFRALSQVKQTLGAVGVPIGGVVFNRYDAEKAGGSHRYGYGYDYSYDYSSPA